MSPSPSDRQPVAGASLTYDEKTQVIADLRSTYTIWSRDHGLEEAMFIATGGGKRRERVTVAIGKAVDAIGADASVRRVIEHAISMVKSA